MPSLQTLVPRIQVTSSISQGHNIPRSFPTPSLNTLGSFVLELNAPYKQTDRRTRTCCPRRPSESARVIKRWLKPLVRPTWITNLYWLCVGRYAMSHRKGQSSRSSVNYWSVETECSRQSRLRRRHLSVCCKNTLTSFIGKSTACKARFPLKRTQRTQRKRLRCVKNRIDSIVAFSCARPGFHYPSWRRELTARVDVWPVSITRQHGPCWRARVSTSPVEHG